MSFAQNFDSLFIGFHEEGELLKTHSGFWQIGFGCFEALYCYSRKRWFKSSTLLVHCTIFCSQHLAVYTRHQGSPIVEMILMLENGALKVFPERNFMLSKSLRRYEHSPTTQKNQTRVSKLFHERRWSSVATQSHPLIWFVVNYCFFTLINIFLDVIYLNVLFTSTILIYMCISNNIYVQKP